MALNERGFEDAIEASLLDHGGFLKSLPSIFDAALGLDTAGTEVYQAARRAGSAE